MKYFAASCDTVEENTKFARSLSLDYPILSDPKREAGIAYGTITGSSKHPSRWTFYIGKNGRILRIDKKVSVRTHGQDIAAQLQRLKIPLKAEP